MNSWIRTGVMVISCTALGGCDFIGSIGKDILAKASSHRGWQTFNFTGQLPSDFGIDAIAFYSPVKPENSSCQAATFTPGKTVTRKYGKRYTLDIGSEPQQFDFTIPLAHYIGFCSMRLSYIKLEINGRHGPQKWQRSYGRGNLYMVRHDHPEAVAFDENGELNKHSICRWTFKQSIARPPRRGEIEKLLSCAEAGAYLPFTELSEKKINLSISVSPDEKPYHDQTWIKFPNGWKPCLPKKGWLRCQSPPLLQTFLLNGKTCTIYPGCEE